MKQFASMLAAILFLLALPLRAAALSPDELTAVSAVLMDADTGQVLYEKNMNAQRAPASITKVLTAMLVLEHASPGERMLVSEQAADIPLDSSHIALRPGEELTVNEALYAMMLPSANDASNVLAEHVSGSGEAFAELMNERVRELGALSSHFTNPHGLPDDNHYTTAYDMALITRAALQTEGFLHYFGTVRYEMQPTNKQKDVRNFSNYQYMLHPEMWVYNEDVIGGKVGFTNPAKHTMTTAARRDGRTLVCIVLGSGKDEKFYDTQVLLDYGFDELFPVTVALPSGRVDDRTATVTEGGEVTGEATFSLGGAETTVLLPAGISAEDITFRYNIPESFASNESSGATVSLVLTAGAGDAHLPPELLTLPLSTRIRKLAVDVDSDADTKGIRVGKWIWLLALIPLFLILMAAVKIQKQKRRAAKRMQRRQRVLAEQQRRYRQQGPRSSGTR